MKSPIVLGALAVGAFFAIRHYLRKREAAAAVTPSGGSSLTMDDSSVVVR